MVGIDIDSDRESLLDDNAECNRSMLTIPPSKEPCGMIGPMRFLVAIVDQESHWTDH